MRSERLVPVSEIFPRISAMLIGSNYTTTLSAEQLSELLPNTPVAQNTILYSEVTSICYLEYTI